MIINLSPQRSDETLSVIKSGDVLTINGEAFDFSPLPDGAELPATAVASAFVIGTVRRVDGDLEITLKLPHGANPPAHIAFPDPIIDPPDGPISLPTEEVSDE